MSVPATLSEAIELWYQTTDNNTTTMMTILTTPSPTSLLDLVTIVIRCSILQSPSLTIIAPAMATSGSTGSRVEIYIQDLSMPKDVLKSLCTHYNDKDETEERGKILVS